MSLSALNDGEFQLLSHTSSTKLRNTYIRKLLEPGEYLLLVEKSSSPLNERLEYKAPEYFKGWRDAVLSSYGPGTCSMAVEECREKHVIYDYLMYNSWRWYAS